ncbi:MAG TPA: YlmC/YmxH family sporulation protein [Firmicutes bacterium]|jgi:YlmC/YmxH family sporulation protein|nr:YlmC/YmxH family sporulation protein [Bacillota bacterium]
MRLSELVGKEVIDVKTGDRLGVIQKSELLVNTQTGRVEALLLVKQGWTGMEKEIQTIPWSDIQKISDELILISGTTGSE